MKNLLLVFLFLFCGSTAHAQRVSTRGYGEADLDATLRAALDRPHELVVRDLTIGRNDTVRAHLVVVRSRLIVEGTIIGDVVGVDANMYFRPNAVVEGTVTNIAGGLYPSEQARLGSVEDRPLAPYHVYDVNGDYVIEGTNRRPLLRLGGMFGFQNPEYNRVDGARLEFGPELLLPPLGGVEPRLFGSVGYATEREDVLFRAGLGLKRGRSTLTFGWEDNVTETNDRWVRSDLKNSLAVIWNGKDYRNYYAAQRWYGEFARTLERGMRTSRYWIRGQREDASPLVASDVFTVLDPDSVRSNPPVPESSITSLILGAQSEWVRPTNVFDGVAWIETAGSTLVDSDFAFNMYGVGALYAMKAIANHTLEIEGNFRGPLPGTEELPQQRWTHVGGSGTLYTYEIAEFRGDRLAMIETEYTIPFSERLRLPILGLPRLRLMHNIGMAWSRDVDRELEQNIGARLQFAFAHIRYVINPANSEDKWSISVGFPPRNYPWEKRQRSPLER
jgi:hypothetical protein